MFRSAIIGAIHISAAAAPPATAQTVAPMTAPAVLVVAGGQAGYRAREQLAGNTLPTVTVGTTTNVGVGSIGLNPDGGVAADQSTISVDLTSLSDEFMRDNLIKRDTLQISQYPAPIFVSDQVRGLASLPPSGQASFESTGKLTSTV